MRGGLLAGSGMRRREKGWVYVYKLLEMQAGG